MNENITTKDLLNLILGNQETPKTTESKEMELEQAISYFLANQIKNSDDTLKYYKIEFNCLKTYFKMFDIRSTKELNNDFALKLINTKKA
ncbi:unknown [Clostridium sp. CAG:307]|nr:unknown [Clostridium sp. CAG:307]